MILGVDGEKMSKSRGNVVNPDELVEKYGADALRLAEIFLGPPEQTTSFQANSVWAMKKWLDRVYRLFTEQREKFVSHADNTPPEITTSYQKMREKTNNYYHKTKLNLVVSSLMTFVNDCYKTANIPLAYGLAFLQLLNPLAPHITEEI
jgi:leucyl-tRNA synthetase